MSDTETLDVSLNDVDFDVPDLETETSEPESPDASATDSVTDGPSDTPAADGPARDANGRFTTKQPKDDAEPAPASAATQTPTGENIEQVAPTEDAVAWQPFTVNVNRETVPLNETLGVQFFVDKASGHAMLALPEANLQRLQETIGRGIHHEKTWQQLQQRERALTERENAPRPPSDAEIQAAVEVEFMAPYIEALFNAGHITARDVQLLEAKVENARYKAQREAATRAEQYQSQQKEQESHAEFQSGQLSAWIQELAGKTYAGKLTQAEVQEMYNDLLGYAPAFLQPREGVAPNAPLHERYVFNDVQLHKEFEKRIKQAEHMKQIAAKSQEAARFNKGVQPSPAPVPPRQAARPTPTKPKASVPTTGKKAFDQLFEDAWKPDNDE